MRITDDGKIMYVSSSTRTGSTGNYLVFRYDMPDFSNFMYNLLYLPSGSDTVCTAEIVENIATGEFWLFGTDISGGMYLSISADSCQTWGSFEQVLTDATMHAAYSDKVGNIYVAYRDLATNEAKLAVFTDPDNYTTNTIAPCASDASPRIAVYRNVLTTIAVTFHNSSDEVVIARSTNLGANWDNQVFSEGRYPNIDIDRLSGECAICFVGPLGVSIDVATANSVQGLFSATAVPASDMPAFSDGPAVVRHDFVQDEYGLLYMGRTDAGYPRDLWFDSSLFTGVEGSGETVAGPVRVYPNPSTGAFTVSFAFAEPRQATLDVYSADGRLVSRIWNGVSAGEDLTVDEELPAGVYSIVLRSASGVSSRRMVSL
jgi:hypothetical protein